MALEFTGTGVLLSFNTVGAPTVYTTLAGTTDLKPPAASIDDIEVTALDSTGKEFIPALADNGEVTFTLMLRKATAGNAAWVASQTAFEAYANDGIVHGFKIIYPGTATLVYTFSGYVKEFAVDPLSPSNAASASCSIKVSGAVTRTVV